MRQISLTLGTKKLTLKKESEDMIPSDSPMVKCSVTIHALESEGINFRTAEGLLLSDLKDAPTTCQRNTLVSHGRVTYFETQGDRGRKRFLRLKITAPLGSDIYNSSFYSLNEIDELKKNQTIPISILTR